MLTSADDSVQDAGDVYIQMIRRPRLQRHVGRRIHLGEPAAETGDAHVVCALSAACLD